MKKIVFVGLLMMAGLQFNTANAQNLNLAQTVQTINKVNNTIKTAKTVSSTLKTALGLSKTQELSLVSTLSKYMKSTNAISKLANTNSASYAAQLLNINNNTLGNIKSILTVAQYAKLLNLGKQSSGISSIFEGMSSSSANTATNVLTGLLSGL